MKKIISNLLICFFLLGFALNIDVNIVKAVNIDMADVLLSGTTSTNQLYIDDNLELTFNVTPTGEIRVERTPVTLVLVIDVSGSMGSGQNSKMEKAKSAARNLIDRIYNNRKTGDKVAIVKFSRGYDVVVGSTNIETGKTTLINGINTLSANSGTNLHGGLLGSKNILASDTNQKHVIVLTDGMPNYYVKNNSNIYDVNNAKVEARKVSIELNNMGAKVHYLGISTASGDIDESFIYNYMKDISGEKHIAKTVDDIDPLLNGIYTQILNQSKVYKNILFEYQIQQGFEVTSLPNGFRVENGKIIGNLNEIKFENMKGTPNVVQSFKIGIKNTRKVGEVNLGNAKINYIVEDNLGVLNSYKEFAVGNVNYNIRDLYNYINFSNLTPTKNLVSNKTVVGIKTNLTKNRLYDFDPNAIAEVEVEFKDKNSNSF